MKLKRHLGHEFIIEDAKGHFYVGYQEDNGDIHSIDPSDDKYIVEPFKIFYRNTDYKGTLKASKKKFKIIDCYWPLMSESEDPYKDIRKRIQFKDAGGEWYKPEIIEIMEYLIK